MTFDVGTLERLPFADDVGGLDAEEGALGRASRGRLGLEEEQVGECGRIATHRDALLDEQLLRLAHQSDDVLAFLGRRVDLVDVDGVVYFDGLPLERDDVAFAVVRQGRTAGSGAAVVQFAGRFRRDHHLVVPDGAVLDRSASGVESGHARAIVFVGVGVRSVGYRWDVAGHWNVRRRVRVHRFGLVHLGLGSVHLGFGLVHLGFRLVLGLVVLDRREEDGGRPVLVLERAVVLRVFDLEAQIGRVVLDGGGCGRRHHQLAVAERLGRDDLPRWPVRSARNRRPSLVLAFQTLPLLILAGLLGQDQAGHNGRHQHQLLHLQRLLGRAGLFFMPFPFQSKTIEFCGHISQASPSDPRIIDHHFLEWTERGPPSWGYLKYGDGHKWNISNNN